MSQLVSNTKSESENRINRIQTRLNQTTKERDDMAKQCQKLKEVFQISIKFVNFFLIKINAIIKEQLISIEKCFGFQELVKEL